MSGSRGSASSQGSTTADASGNVSGSRDTTVTSGSGTSYQGNASYDQSTGVTHTGTCKNADGVEVSCTK